MTAPAGARLAVWPTDPGETANPVTRRRRRAVLDVIVLADEQREPHAASAEAIVEGRRAARRRQRRLAPRHAALQPEGDVQRSFADRARRWRGTCSVSSASRRPSTPTPSWHSMTGTSGCSPSSNRWTSGSSGIISAPTTKATSTRRTAATSAAPRSNTGSVRAVTTAAGSMSAPTRTRGPTVSRPTTT